MKRKVLMGLLYLTWMSIAVANAAPVEYVKVCQLHGSGFYYVPGTDQCYEATTGTLIISTEQGQIVTESQLAQRVTQLEIQLQHLYEQLNIKSTGHKK